MSIIIGSGVAQVADETIQRAIPHAAHKLGCKADDISFADGVFLAKSSNQSLQLEDLVIALSPDRGPHPFDKYFAYVSDGATYPHGCHVAEIEVDQGTAIARIVRYTVVDDFGLVLNPVTLRGQIQGGIAQGIGQALYENAAFDDNAQPMVKNMLDYTLPRADHLPSLDVHFRSTPTENNLLGVKGAGQAGIIGSAQAVISALCDALGVVHIDMPATPAIIWKVMQEQLSQKAS